MRVTENTNYETIRDSIRRSRGKMENLQTQQSTLKKINTPSDDPVGAAKILEIRTEKVNNEQFITNTKLAAAGLENTDHALGEIADIVARAKEIAINQSSGPSANENSRLGVAEEVGQLYKQAVATANARVGDRYLFGGYRTNKPPITQDGEYQGDEGQQMIEISRNVYLTGNVHGLEAFNTNPKGVSEELAPNRGPASVDPEGSARPENVNVFQELQNLRIALLTEDTDGIRGTLERFDQVHGKLISVRAQVGSRLQGLQSASIANEKHNITNAQVSSMLEDADMAQVVSDLAKEETIFRSALQSSQKLIQPTLLDFLK